MTSGDEANTEETETDEDVPIEYETDPDDDDLSWGERARKRMRRIQLEKVELPLSQLVAMVDSEQIDLAPAFQRRARWTRKQRSRLVESVLMNVPIPPVFLGEEEYGQYVVLDGRQRLSALYDYLQNQFPLAGLTVWPELNGKRFRTLAKLSDPAANEPMIDRAITRRFIPAVLIREESLPAVKYEVFDRLNTGGVIAEAMEVRNAVFRGPFNKQLHTLADNTAFRELWGIPTDDKDRERSPTYKKMADLELVLRFFAMQSFEEFRGRLKSFLNEVMERRNELYKEDPQAAVEDRQVFESTMRRTLELLGPNALHRILDSGQHSNVPSAPLADAVLFGISRLASDRPTDAEVSQIRQAVRRLQVEDDRFSRTISSGTNDRAGTRYRMRAAERAIAYGEEPWSMTEPEKDLLAE